MELSLAGTKHKTFIIILLLVSPFLIFTMFTSGRNLSPNGAIKAAPKYPPQLLTGWEKNEAEKAHNGRGQLKSITRRCSINHSGRSCAAFKSPILARRIYICRYVHIYIPIWLCVGGAPPEMEKQLIIPNVSQQMGCWWICIMMCAHEKHIHTNIRWGRNHCCSRWKIHSGGVESADRMH